MISGIGTPKSQSKIGIVQFPFNDRIATDVVAPKFNQAHRYNTDRNFLIDPRVRAQIYYQSGKCSV